MTGNMLDRAQASFVRALAARIRRGTIVLHDRAGTHRFGEGEPEVHVTVHQDAAYGKVLRGGSVALGDTYADGEWECDDPTALVTILWRNLAGLAAVTDRIGRASARTADWVRRRRPEDPERDRENIRRHYDLSNELFELMLDPTMMYSSAVFTRPGMTLEEASTAKVDRLCAKLGIGPGDHVVEIGTGWGGFRHPGCLHHRVPGHDHHHLRGPVRVRDEAGGRRRPHRTRARAGSGLPRTGGDLRQAGVYRDGCGYFSTTPKSLFRGYFWAREAAP